MATGDSVWPRRSEKDLIVWIFSVKRPIYAKRNDDPPLSQKAIIVFLSVSQSQILPINATKRLEKASTIVIQLFLTSSSVLYSSFFSVNECYASNFSLIVTYAIVACNVDERNEKKSLSGLRLLRDKISNM